jgi:hypothetical protein
MRSWRCGGACAREAPERREVSARALMAIAVAAGWFWPRLMISSQIARCRSIQAASTAGRRTRGRQELELDSRRALRRRVCFAMLVDKVRRRGRGVPGSTRAACRAVSLSAAWPPGHSRRCGRWSRRNRKREDAFCAMSLGPGSDGALAFLLPDTQSPCRERACRQALSSFSSGFLEAATRKRNRPRAKSGS